MPTRHLGEALALAAAVAFSFKAILVKLALATGADPIALLVARMWLAAPLFVAMVAALPGPRPTREEALQLAAMGIVGFYAASVLDFLGLRDLTAGLERIVLYTHPTFVLLFGAWWSSRQPSHRAMAAIAVAWTGLLIAAGADLAVTSPPSLARGVALVLGCAVLYAGYLLGVERLSPRLGPVRVMAMANLTATAALTAHAGLGLHAEVAALAPRAWGLALAMATLSTALPAALLALAVRRIGAARSATMGMVGPVAASLLGWATLGEPLSAMQLVGGVVVVMGVSLASAERRGAAALPVTAR